MRAHRRLPAGGWRAAVLLSVVAGLLGIPLAQAEAVQRPRTLYAERPVATGAVEPGFPIDHVGVVFDLPAHADEEHDHEGDEHEGAEHLEVRFRTDGRWGPWQEMTEDGAQAIGTWTGALVPGGDAEAYQVRGLPSFASGARAAAINTTDGELETVGHRPAGSAEAVTTCRSRADWGADESLRTSTRSYAPIQIATVHHTATQNDDPDPDARVRAIYQYHTRTNGWDDIGYQALISEAGVVYEGRWSGSDSPSCAVGGTGWEFGHATDAATSDIVSGAHTGGYNTGNFGVALLGTLSDVAPKAAARDALVEYLAELAERHGLDPVGTVQYDNGTNAATVDTISGHQDLSATECPGGVLYADLNDQLRPDVAAAMASGPRVTISLPADADTYVVEASTDGTAAVRFAASATDDATSADLLAWTWRRDGVVVASSTTHEAALAPGTYVFTATATDGDGETGSDEITVTVLAAGGTSTTETRDVTSGEQPVSGTVSGTHVDTHRDDAVAQTVTEVESGGRPADRRSQLEHVWTVPVTGGDAVTLLVDASATSSGEPDDFLFATSTDGGATYAPALTVPAGTAGTFTAALPAGTAGTVHVRVTDTDRTRGARTLDAITVDQLVVVSESGTSVTPATPTGFASTGSTATTIDLAWSDVEGEQGYELDRSADGGATWTRIASLGADVVSYRDGGLTSSTTYAYRLRAHNTAGRSAWTEPTTASTAVASAITLTTSGRKVQGSHVVDLSWTGAADVVVHREGAGEVQRVTGSSWSDHTGGKGGGSYTHWVCAAADPDVCSAKVTTTFS